MIVMPHKQRIPQQIRRPIRRNNVVPVDPQGIAMNDMRRFLERQAGIVLAELLRHLQVHLVIGQPQSHLCNPRRPLLDLYAVELIDVDADELEDIQHELVALAHITQYLQLQQAQLAISNNKEVAAAASRVEESQVRKLFQKLEKLVPVALDLVELGPQLIEKKRVDQLEDIGFAGVVGTQITPGGSVHDRLEQRTEDGRRNAAPVKSTAVQQRFTHLPGAI